MGIAVHNLDDRLFQEPVLFVQKLHRLGQGIGHGGGRRADQILPLGGGFGVALHLHLNGAVFGIPIEFHMDHLFFLLLYCAFIKSRHRLARGCFEKSLLLLNNRCGIRRPGTGTEIVFVL